MIKLPSKKTLINTFLILTILLIVLQVVFYFLISDIVYPPDYDFHSYITTLFKNNPLTIFFLNFDNLKLCSILKSSEVGLVVTSPNFYANIMGKLLFLVDLILKNENLSLNIVELLQTSFGLLNIYYIYKISGFVFKEKLPRIFVVFILINIQMFSYLINYLTYDNLVNLASSASIFYLLNYFKKRDIKDLILLGIFLSIGTLTKYTFGVLLVMIVIVLLFHERSRLKSLIKDLGSYIFKSKNLILKFALFVLISLNIFFYAHNVIVNKTLIPSSSAGRSYCSEESSKEVEKIEAPEQIAPVEETQEEEEEPIQIERVPKKGLFSYFKQWFLLMVERTFNIASHESILKPAIYTRVFSFLIILSLILFLAKYRFKNKYINILTFFFFGYLIFLYLYRYNIYVSREGDTGNLGIAGRYMFPVISSYVILFVYSFWNILKNKTIPIIILIFISLFFLYSDKFFLLEDYDSWAIANGREIESEVGFLYKGESSPYQKFFIEDQFSTNKIAVHTSTLHESIEGGFRLNLYEDDCSSLIGAYELQGIPDNYYLVVEFSESLVHNQIYCFNIENVDSEKPIILWYSKNDLNGEIEGEPNKDILYSPLEKYGVEFLKQFSF